MTPSHRRVTTEYHDLERVPLDKPFTSLDVDVSTDTLRKWRNDVLIAVVDHVPHPDVKGRELVVYRVTPEVREIVQEYDPHPTMPCGHRGFVNRQGQGYTCGYERCDAVFTREAVEASLAGEADADGATEVEV